MKSRVDFETLKRKPHRATPVGGGIYPVAGTVIGLVTVGILVAIAW